MLHPVLVTMLTLNITTMLAAQEINDGQRPAGAANANSVADKFRDNPSDPRALNAYAIAALQDVYSVMQKSEDQSPYMSTDARTDAAVGQLLALKVAPENQRTINHALAVLYTRRRQWPEVLQALDKIDETDPWFFFGMQWRILSRVALRDDQGLEADVARVAVELAKKPATLEFWTGREWLTLTAENLDNRREQFSGGRLREFQPGPKIFTQLLRLRVFLPAKATPQNMSSSLVAVAEHIDRLAAAQSGPRQEFVRENGFRAGGEINNRAQLLTGEIALVQPPTHATLSQLLPVQERLMNAALSESARLRMELIELDRTEGRRGNGRTYPQVDGELSKWRQQADKEAQKWGVLKHLVDTTRDIKGEIYDLDARIGLWSFLRVSQYTRSDILPFFRSEIDRIGRADSKPEAIVALAMLASIVDSQGRARDHACFLKDKSGNTKARQLYQRGQSSDPPSGLLAVTLGLVEASYQSDQERGGDWLRVDRRDPFYFDGLLLGVIAAVAYDDVPAIEKYMNLLTVDWENNAAASEPQQGFYEAGGDDPRKTSIDRLKFMIALRSVLEVRPTDKHTPQVAALSEKLSAMNLDKRVHSPSGSFAERYRYFYAPGDLESISSLEAPSRQAQPPDRQLKYADIVRFTGMNVIFRDQLFANLGQPRNGARIINPEPQHIVQVHSYTAGEVVRFGYATLWQLYCKDIQDRLYLRLRHTCEHALRLK